jgi:hypothetical protein
VAPSEIPISDTVAVVRAYFHPKAGERKFMVNSRENRFGD